jgi:hypothetical protein
VDARRGAAQHHMVLGRDLGRPAGLYHDRLVRLDDQRRTGEPMAGLQRVAQEQGRLTPRSLREHRAAAGARNRLVLGGERPVRLLDFRPAADRLRLYRLRHQRLPLVDEAEAGAVLPLEGGAHRRRVAEADRQRHIGAVVAHMHAPLDLDLRPAKPLILKLPPRLRDKR